MRVQPLGQEDPPVWEDHCFPGGPVTAPSPLPLLCSLLIRFASQELTLSCDLPAIKEYMQICSGLWEACI